MIDRERLQTYAHSLGITVEEPTLEKLDRYAQMLIETNAHINLTAITDPLDVTDKHFADSLTILTVCDPQPNAKWIDVGTGAGFPGAALLIVRPDLQMTLLDGTKKKLHFVQTALESLDLSANVVHARAEEAGQDPAFRAQYDFVTARAVAALRELSEYCLPFLRVGGVFIAMKAGVCEQELAEAASAIRLLGGKVQTVHTRTLPNGDERTLIVIQKISQTPTKYPRSSAKIAKQPLR